jgi:hypothetical protein
MIPFFYCNVNITICLFIISNRETGRDPPFFHSFFLQFVLPLKRSCDIWRYSNEFLYASVALPLFFYWSAYAKPWKVIDLCVRVSILSLSTILFYLVLVIKFKVSNALLQDYALF